MATKTEHKHENSIKELKENGSTDKSMKKMSSVGKLNKSNKNKEIPKEIPKDIPKESSKETSKDSTPNAGSRNKKSNRSLNGVGLASFNSSSSANNTNNAKNSNADALKVTQASSNSYINSTLLDCVEIIPDSKQKSGKMYEVPTLDTIVRIDIKPNGIQTSNPRVNVVSTQNNGAYANSNLISNANSNQGSLPPASSGHAIQKLMKAAGQKRNSMNKKESKVQSNEKNIKSQSDEISKERKIDSHTDISNDRKLMSNSTENQQIKRRSTDASASKRTETTIEQTLPKEFHDNSNGKNKVHQLPTVNNKNSSSDTLKQTNQSSNINHKTKNQNTLNSDENEVKSSGSSVPITNHSNESKGKKNSASQNRNIEETKNIANDTNTSIDKFSSKTSTLKNDMDVKKENTRANNFILRANSKLEKQEQREKSGQRYGRKIEGKEDDVENRAVDLTDETLSFLKSHKKFLFSIVSTRDPEGISKDLKEYMQRNHCFQIFFTLLDILNKRQKKKNIPKISDILVRELVQNLLQERSRILRKKSGEDPKSEGLRKPESSIQTNMNLNEAQSPSKIHSPIEKNRHTIPSVKNSHEEAILSEFRTSKVENPNYNERKEEILEVPIDATTIEEKVIQTSTLRFNRGEDIETNAFPETSSSPKESEGSSLTTRHFATTASSHLSSTYPSSAASSNSVPQNDAFAISPSYYPQYIITDPYSSHYFQRYYTQSYNGAYMYPRNSYTDTIASLQSDNRTLKERVSNLETELKNLKSVLRNNLKLEL